MCVYDFKFTCYVKQKWFCSVVLKMMKLTKIKIKGVVLMSRNIVFVSAYLKGNLGDDLFIYILSKLFKKQNFVLESERRYTGQFSSLDNIKVVNNSSVLFKIWRKIMNIAKINNRKRKKYQAIIEIGGSIFQQQEMGELIPKRRIDWLDSGVPYFVIGSNFGRFLEQHFVDEYAKFFRKTNATVFRDLNSYAMFEYPNVFYAPDVVFNLPKVFTPQLINNGRKTIILVPIDLSNIMRLSSEKLNNYTELYERKYAQIADEAVLKGYEVVFMSFCEAEGDNDAIERITLLTNKVTQNQSSIVGNYNIEEKLTIIANAEYMVGSRFHAMILGWVYNVKQCVVSYSNKTVDVISDIFPDQYSMSVEDFSKIDHIKFKEFNTISTDKLIQVIDSASEQFRPFSEFIN